MPPTIGLKLLHAGDNPVFDIVAVHGLNGGAYHTWTYTEKGEKDVLWLRDLLPREIQDARIFTYGYDSMSAQVAGSASTKFLHHHAEALLQDLHAHRRDQEVFRPIIFIAHSLGGILVKQALINSGDCYIGHNEHLRSIVNSTYGIMFMGTPNSGSGLASWGRFAESIISSVFPRVFIDTNPHLINTLGRDSEVLQNITKRFTAIQRQNNFRIFYFFEELRTKLPNGRMETVVQYSSAVPEGVPDVQSYGIHGDHRNICRFKNEESPGYEVLVRALIDWREAASEVVNQKWVQYRDHITVTAMHNMPVTGSGPHLNSVFLLPSSSSEARLSSGKQIIPIENDISPLSSTITLAPNPQFIVPHYHYPNEVFEGRQEDLERLDQILQNLRKRERGNASAVVSGISGSGKTHLVRQYVYEKRANYPGGVFWVESMSAATIKLGYWKLALGLGLTDRTPFREESHHDFFIELVIHWFKSNSKWLLVLDGADHETEEEVDMLKDIIPGGNGGAIIITSINKALAGRARLGSPEGLFLKNLEREDCINILFQYARIEEPSEDDRRDAEELVGLMDLLPLAIHSAGSAITAMQIDLGNYLRYYKKQPKVEGLTSFHLILDQLQKRYSEAFNLIYILSFVERKIPVAMLEWGMKKWAGPPLVVDRDGFGLNATLRHLLSYSLIERKSVAEIDHPGRVDTLLVHKVVQDICRMRMEREKTYDQWFHYASKLFCKSFQRMERRRRDKNFSVSDYRRFQVHITKILNHGMTMRVGAGELSELEETLTRIKDAITRSTPKYNSQSIDNGDDEYLPPRSQFSGSWSSFDESSGSASEAINAEIVIAPHRIVESPIDHEVHNFPFVSIRYEASSPTVVPGDSPRQIPSPANSTPSPSGRSNHPYGPPSGSPPTAPPHLPRQFIPSLTPPNRTSPLSPPYPPTPGGPIKFPSHPILYAYESAEDSITLNRNYSDPALVKLRSSISEQASRSHGDLIAGPGRMSGSLPTSVNRPHQLQSRDSLAWSGSVDMARAQSEGNKRGSKYTSVVTPRLSSEPMSRSTSGGSASGGVTIPWPSHSGARSRQGSVSSFSRYHMLSTLPIPPLSAENESRDEREILSRERHPRKGSAPGFLVDDEVIEIGTSPPHIISESADSRCDSTVGLGINLSPTTNTIENHASLRRSSAPEAVQEVGVPLYARPQQLASAVTRTNSPLSESYSTVFSSPSLPASILEAAGVPMQRCSSEPTATGAVSHISTGRDPILIVGPSKAAARGRASLRHVSRAISPLRKGGKKYSPRELYLMEYEGSADEGPLIESWAEEANRESTAQGE